MTLYPDGRLFAYGTLMFDSVVVGLLDHSLSRTAATLLEYERVAIDRGKGGAKGPVLFPRPGARTRGVVLEGVSLRDQKTLNRFEAAASGYDLIEVEVMTDSGECLRAAVYCGREELRPLTGGSWSPHEYEGQHLEHYLTTRIPRLRRQWDEEERA